MPNAIGLPLVSAVIPTHKRPTLLLRAVRSALGQTYENLEVIVVIDGVEPETATMLAELNDPRLKTITLEQNRGGNTARNIGISTARGEWIALLDDDDEWMPEKTTRQISFLSTVDPSTNFVVCRYRQADTGFGHQVLPRDFPLPGEEWSEFLLSRRNIPGMLTYLVRREFIRAIPFTERLSSCQDLDWLLRAGQSGALRAAWLHDALAICHNDSQVMRTSHKGDWKEFSDWLLRSRDLVTRRAFSHCLAVHGAARIKAANYSSIQKHCALLRLLRLAMLHGRIDLHFVFYLILFRFCDATTRTQLRAVFEQLRSRNALAT